MFVNSTKKSWFSEVVVYKDSLFTSQRKLCASIRKNIHTFIICKICIANNATRFENFTMET